MALVNVPDFLKIGVMAFVAVFLINHALVKVGMGQFKA